LRIAGTLLAAILVLGPWLQPVVELRRFLVGMGILLAFSSWQGARLMGRRGQGPALALMGAAGLLVVIQLRVLMPAVEQLKPAPRLAMAVRETVPAETPVWAAGFREPSLVFYLGRPLTELARAEVPAWLASDRYGVLITEAELLADAVEPTLRVVARDRGFNVAKGEWVEVVAVWRDAQAAESSPP
jgi:hypothetical protein